VSRHVKLDTTQKIFWQPKNKIMDQATNIKKKTDRHFGKVRKRKPWAAEIDAEAACLSPIRCDLPAFPRVAIDRLVNRDGGVAYFPTGACSSLRRVITERHLLYVNEIRG